MRKGICKSRTWYKGMKQMHMASDKYIAWRMDTGIGLHRPILSVVGQWVSVHQMAQYYNIIRLRRPCPIVEGSNLFTPLYCSSHRVFVRKIELHLSSAAITLLTGNTALHFFSSLFFYKSTSALFHPTCSYQPQKRETPGETGSSVQL